MSTENDDWRQEFLATWIARDPDLDRAFVLRVAQRSCEHEVSRVAPDVAASEHFSLLRRIREARVP